VLVLSRKLNQSIMIGDDVRIVVVSVDRDTVKLGIEAPRAIPVHRSEVYEEIQLANRAAASGPAVDETEAKPGVAVLGTIQSAKLMPQKRGKP
jgi:carbon storage regulator